MIEMNFESTPRFEVRFRCSQFYLKWEVISFQTKISVVIVIVHHNDVSRLMRSEEQREGQVELTILCQFLPGPVVWLFVLITY